MIFVIFLLLATCFLAYSNGANDNFKGVATLFGSNTCNYRKALTWASVTTFAGSICSVFIAQALIKSFSGKGLVPDSLAASPDFLFPVAVGAGLTVILASLVGLPISTTHSLTGALVGSGFVAVGTQVNLNVLGKTFFLPLMISPFLAMAMGAFLYRLFSSVRQHLGIEKETCLCVGERQAVITNFSIKSGTTNVTVPIPGITVDTENYCQEIYQGKLLGINSQKTLDFFHYTSSGLVSFARGLNDTPKIVALNLAVQALNINFGMLAVALAMLLGGLLNASKVAKTMSKKITPLNSGQGFTANLVTSLLVIFASRWGLPVSTTHVSVGSIFGIGIITRKANKRTISAILLSWFVTLPMAALLSGLVFWLFK